MGYSRGKRWDENKIKSEILKVMTLLNIDRMPSSVEIRKVTNSTSLCNAINKRGGFNHWANIMTLEQSECETRVGLSEEFKELSTAMITNSYKKTKALVREEEKLKKIAEREDISDKTKDITEEVDKEIEDALEYIFEEDTKEAKNKACTEEKEVGQANISDNEEKANIGKNKGDKKMSKLKVIKEVTKVVERYIQGEYGLYNVKGTVVTVDEEFAFSNVEDVKGWASSEREDLLKQIAEIKSKINHINSCELEAIEVIETYM